MKQSFDFSLILSGVKMTDELADSLYSAGCDDGTISGCEGIVAIDFSREADSLQDAIRSAIANVQSAGCTVAKVEMEPDAVVQNG